MSDIGKRCGYVCDVCYDMGWKDERLWTVDHAKRSK